MDKAKICVDGAKKVSKYTKNIKDGQKLLLYEKPRKRNAPAIKCVNLGCNKPTPAKKIRVCTGAEIKKMCPRISACKPLPPPDDSMMFLARLLWFAIKAAIAGGIVFITIHAGLWGDNDDTQKLYESMCAYIKRRIMGIEDDDEEMDEDLQLVVGYCEQNKIFMEIDNTKKKCPLPTEDENIYYVQKKWNANIIQIGTFIMAGPVSWVRSISDWWHATGDPDVETSKKKGAAVKENLKAVKSYNENVVKYEEDAIRLREERIIALKEQYEKRLKYMKMQEEQGDAFVPPAEEQEDINSCC